MIEVQDGKQIDDNFNQDEDVDETDSNFFFLFFKYSITTGRRQHSSIRRGSQFHEVHIAMLPDLSGKIPIQLTKNFYASEQT